MDLRDISILSVLIRIVSAFLFGAILGWEREIKNRAAGLRTYMLVCMGACIIMLTNQYIYQFFGVGDPVRMGAQVVSGIGFLGAGTIVVTRHNKIIGLTTAAGLWAAAAIGLALGIGFYEVSLIGALFIIITQTIMHGLNDRIRRKARHMELYVEIENNVSIGKLAKNIRELGVKIEDIQIDRNYTLDNGIRALVISVHPLKKTNHQDLLAEMQEMEGLIYLEEI